MNRFFLLMLILPGIGSVGFFSPLKAAPLFLHPNSRTQSDSKLIRAFPAIDRVWMKNGAEYHGLIVKNSSRQIVLQNDQGEFTLLKADILRFDDTSTSMLYFSDLVNPHELPAWRMMVQDFRSSDLVEAFYEIPPIRITQGPLRYIPYLSFAINEKSFFHIFGNPEHPVAISLGTYQRGARRKIFWELAREFMAGYMTSRDEITTLYQLHYPKDTREAGNFRFHTDDSSQMSEEGGWFLTVEKPAALEKVRITPCSYDQKTLSFLEVRKKNGSLRYPPETVLSKQLREWTARYLNLKIPWRGFYRTKNHQLKLFSVPKIDSS